jgi:hypothetical protein
MIMKTMRFNTPPMLEKVVTKWGTAVGTPSGLTNVHTPLTANAHHCMINAKTNSDIERAAL